MKRPQAWSATNQMRSLALLVTILLLAGCSGSSKAPTPSPTETGPPPLVPADANYGGIEGYVHDADIVPLAGVNVTVTDLGRTVVTDALGYYSILPLDPGTYALEVNHTGFAPLRRSVSVTPGQGLRVDFPLRALPSPQPYIDDSYIRRGHIDCQARANLTPTNTNTNPDCTEAGETVTGPYLPPGRSANITLAPDAYALLVEVQWTPTMASNEKLRVAVRPNEGTTWQQFEGTSVLRIEIGEQRMQEMGRFAEKDYRAQGGQLFFLVFAGEAANAGGVGAGATIQQDYTLYVTVFYRMGIPDNYSRLAP